MNYLTFSRTFGPQKAVSIRDIQKEFPDFNFDNLTNWQKKGYLVKIRNGWYVFPEALKTEADLNWLANRLHRPSYVSLETALRYYDFIPESVFSITSITTAKPAEWHTPIGHFAYRSVKPPLFFGYQASGTDPAFLIADPEKALIDFLYLNPRFSKPEDFAGLRLNESELLAKMNPDRAYEYLSIIGSSALEKRWKGLQKFLGS
jgi:predicted transcriptional regulator of viral defense system